MGDFYKLFTDGTFSGLFVYFGCSCFWSHATNYW